MLRARSPRFIIVINEIAKRGFSRFHKFLFLYIKLHNETYKKEKLKLL
jgi:hypothetical protein